MSWGYITPILTIKMLKNPGWISRTTKIDILGRKKSTLSLGRKKYRENYGKRSTFNKLNRKKSNWILKRTTN